MNNSKTEAGRKDIEDVLGIGAMAIPWWRSWRMLGLAALLIVAAMAGYAFLASSNTSQNTQYKTAVVTRDGLTVTVTATGTVEPTNEVEISSELSGMIMTVNVDYNDQVTSGQVLAELDTDKLKGY